MALEEDLVTAAGVVLATPEVVEAHLVERGGRGVGGDVAADADSRTLRTVHHHGGVPAQQSPHLTLERLVAGVLRLLVGGDGVHVVSAGQRGDADLLLARTLEQLQHHVAGTVTTAGLDDPVE